MHPANYGLYLQYRAEMRKEKEKMEQEKQQKQVNFPMGVFTKLCNTQDGKTYHITIDPAQFRGNPVNENGRTSFFVKVGRSGKAYAELCNGQTYRDTTEQAKTETVVDDEEIPF